MYIKTVVNNKKLSNYRRDGRTLT